MVIQWLRIAFIDDCSRLDHNCTARDRQAEGQILLDHEDGCSEPLVYGDDRLHDPLDQIRSESDRRLIEDQHAGSMHERHANCEHLLLTTGKRSGDLLCALLQNGKQTEDAFETLCYLRRIRFRESAELEVVLND